MHGTPGIRNGGPGGVIRSFLGTSLIEYPGRISSVVFFGGCNLYCPFCHNPELVKPDILAEQYTLDEDAVVRMLSERSGFVDGVCITGGEPLLSPGLPGFLGRIRSETGLAVKLDTNGTLPDRLSEVLDLVDYVAMDLKAAPEAYGRATGGKASFEDVLRSIDLVKSIPGYEFRTTLVPGLVSAGDLPGMLERTGRIRRYVLQRFRPGKTLSPDYSGITPYPPGYAEEAAALVRYLADEVLVRG